MVHVLMEHRHGLPIDVEVTEANGRAERDAALTMLDRLSRRERRTLAADKAYDAAEFLADCRARGVTPHVACNDGRAGGSALDARTTRHAGYRWSQRIRKRIEEGFGWGKDGRPLRKMKHTGLSQVSFMATLTVGCYALLRVAKLLTPPLAAPT
jgi:IS5 family transposase